MDDQSGAATTVVAMLIASAVFIGTVGYLVLESGSVGDSQTGQNEALRLQADAVSLSHVLLHSPGLTLDGQDWVLSDEGPDNLMRLGLRDANGNHLNHTKFDNLRLAPFTADEEDGYVNYEEAVATLGMDDSGHGFHVRAYPTLPSVRELLETGKKDPFMRVTYIGDWERESGGGDPDDGLQVDDLSCEPSPDDSRSWRISTRIFNGGGGPTQFHAQWSLDLDGNEDEDVQRTSNSFMVSKDTWTDVHADFAAKGGRACSDATLVTLDIWDPNTRLSSKTGLSFPEPSASPTSVTKDLRVDTSRTSFRTTDDVELDYGGDVTKDEILYLQLHDAAGVLRYDEEHEVPQGQGQRQITVPAFGEALDLNATLQHNGTGVVATQRVLIVDPAPADYDAGGGGGYVAQEPVAHEVGFLEQLAERFCPFEYDSKTVSPLASPPPWEDRCEEYKAGMDQPSDVVPDLKRVMDDDLPLRLIDQDTGKPRYDITSVLVVGSQVSQSAMTSASAKHAVRDWVQGGGMLIVYGSYSQNVQWLQPLFQSGIHSSSGGLSTPDESHPLLRTPDRLTYDAYENNDLAWRLNAGHDEYFSNVVEQDGAPVTGVSDPGAFGKGTVILTTWQPYDVFGDGPGTAGLEGMKLANNLLTIGYRSLYLDYGPPLPDQVTVIPAATKASILHPDLGPVTLDVVVYVFPS